MSGSAVVIGAAETDRLGIIDDVSPLQLHAEAVRNAIAHGRADKVEIYLISHQEQIVLTVRDNGRGFDPRVAEQGLGFRTMGSRAHSIGGSCELESRARGTMLICRVPIDRRPTQVS